MPSALRLYNTLSRKLEVFKPLKNKTVGLYTCGPTVYNFAHIGNLRTYIFEDILERALEWNGYEVKRVMNITDVGHLTGDTDEGRDKVEEEARAERKSVEEIAERYTKAFLADIKKLNIKVPKTIAPATKYVKEQKALIKELFEKGYAYETDSAVYFEVAKFKDYGKLSGQSLREKLTAARDEVVHDPQKRHPADFALWFKAVGRFRNHILRWPSPWGEGFPGWHVECSAISRKFLGQPFDIHTGGVDHIGTHHPNEIAQSEAAYGKPLARYWLHGEYLLMNAAKMAKSERNFLTLSDLTEKGFSPLAFRYLVLGTHYRSRMNFSWKSLEAAQSALKKINNSSVVYQMRSFHRVNTYPPSGGAKKYYGAFTLAISSDLNTPQALAVLHAVIDAKNIVLHDKISLIKKFDEVLGLNIGKGKKPREIIPMKINDLAEKREQFRNNKQFVQADTLRQEIEKLGYVIDDTPKGPRIRRRN